MRHSGKSHFRELLDLSLWYNLPFIFTPFLSYSIISNNMHHFLFVQKTKSFSKLQSFPQQHFASLKYCGFFCKIILVCMIDLHLCVILRIPPEIFCLQDHVAVSRQFLKHLLQIQRETSELFFQALPISFLLNLADQCMQETYNRKY